MALLNKILAWSATDLTLWQRDALRRLFQKKVLEQEDYDELYLMLKSAHGLCDSLSSQPLPLMQEHLPVDMVNSAPVLLQAMRDLKHVNRIASGQKLEFAHKGITVIYGRNGSGKSGYSRVLKRACRARDISETVHPNAFDTNVVASIPEAVFDIKVDGHTKSLPWKRDTASPDVLSTIAVFDSKCAQIYLDAEQDVAYLPNGLDIVENLGRSVLPKLAQRLDAEINAINTDVLPFADLRGDTIVGKAITSLSPDTDPQKITMLATLTSDEISRLAELNKMLSENNPKIKAQALRVFAQRIDGLIARIDTSNIWVSDAAVTKAMGYDMEAQVSFRAEALAAENFRVGAPLLPGTGEQMWKNLFEAARRFSTEIAYPTHIFPHVSHDAQCLLCQQPFDQDATKRMQRFENYVKQDATKMATEKRLQLEKANQKISEVVLEFGLDTPTIEEFKQLDASLLQKIQEYEIKVEARRKWILTSFKTHAWSNVPVLNGNPQSELKSLSESLVTQAVELDKVDNEHKRKILEENREQLQARANLSVRLSAVLDIIQKMQIKAKLEKCKSDLKTRTISDKAKEFANQAVTAELKLALDREFKALGIGHIRTKLTQRVEQAKMKHKLVLDLPIAKKLNEILSEGEQRAIAIGSFLAELYLSDHNGGIIFDDPVSSLDHYYRKKVAHRLVEEGKKRQVIIFTHDLTFLRELWEESSCQKTEIVARSVDCLGSSTGIVSKNIPWSGLKIKQRIHMLDNLLAIAKRLEKEAKPEEYKHNLREFYDLLRATWEHTVEELLFNKVVERLESNIKIMSLDGVQIDFASVQSVLNGWQRASVVIDSHDHAPAENYTMPEIDTMTSDLQFFKDFVNEQNAKKMASEKQHVNLKKKVPLDS